VTKVDGAQKTAAEVIIYICFPDELDFHFFANTVTDEEGQFDYVWTPTPFYEAGSYKLRALWHGDETTYGNKSETIDIILQSITIFIRADGSVDPSDAPIQRNGDRYTLTRNVGTNTDAIVIEKDNIVLDGAGHRLQGYGTGIHLLGRTNVTIRNLEIRSFGINQYFYISFDCGMNLFNSSHNTICGNNFLHEEFFAKGGKAIQLVSSSNNTICRNTITNEYKAIILVESSNQNTISENTMTNNTYSVLVGESLSNIIARNYMTNNTYGITTKNAANSNIEENTINNGQTGIKINYSDNNVISGNELIDNTVGIGIFDSDFNAIFENEILKNELGINFGCASGNRIYHNNFINNTEQIGVSDSILDDGYPSGGNYWSDYNGTDKYSGPYQNVSGNDGIGDMPYFIDIIHMDNYPLIKPWPRRATVDIQPHTINLQNGKVPITTYIELLKGSNLTQINIFSILLNNTLPANTLIPLTYGDYDSDTIPDLMINFNKTKVSDFILSRGITTGTITLTITGQLYDGASFVRSVIIKVRMAGDVSIDGKVDGKDLAVIAKAFGSNPTRPNWNPVADENEDGKIDGKDIVYIAKNFGRIYA
jgi:parallel beta-helix repeat protein